MRALALVLALLCGPLYAAPGHVARGLRNHNPGNLECRNFKRWGAVSCDGAYAVFSTDRAGLKALRANLRAYWRKHHLCTIDSIVKRWTINDRDSTGYLWGYERGVSIKCQKQPDEKLDMTDPDQLEALGHAIVLEECGSDPYSKALWKSVFHPRRNKP